MPKNKYFYRHIFVTAAALVLCLIPASTVLGAKADSVQNVAQSYKTAAALQQGLLVQIDDKDKDAVKVLTQKEAKKAFGVVVGVGDTPVSLSPSSGDSQAYVVTSGRYRVLVSDQNGAIAKGEFVAPSKVDGVAMKADSEVSTVIGRTVNAFDGKSEVLSTIDVKSTNGKPQKVAIGMVTVDIAIKPNPLLTGSDSGMPVFVVDIATAVAGQPVSVPQIIASLAVLISGLVVVAILLYSGIRSAMQSIGRNPLARQSIMRNLVQVIITAIIIFIGCLIAVYLLLKL